MIYFHAMNSRIAILAFSLLYLIQVQLSAQEKRKNYFPVWTFRQENVNIHGISVGFFSRPEQVQTNTNGIKIELIGVGIIAAAFIPRSPVAQNDSEYTAYTADSISERINGLDLSVAGGFCDCKTNGIKVGGLFLSNRKTNGISVTTELNFAQVHNGAQISGLHNEAFFMHGIQVSVLLNKAHYARGLQLALFNKSEDLKGIQIGLWNTNSKRKLPILNWSF